MIVIALLSVDDRSWKGNCSPKKGLLLNADSLSRLYIVISYSKTFVQIWLPMGELQFQLHKDASICWRTLSQVLQSCTMSNRSLLMAETSISILHRLKILSILWRCVESELCSILKSIFFHAFLSFWKVKEGHHSLNKSSKKWHLWNQTLPPSKPDDSRKASV